MRRRWGVWAWGAALGVVVALWLVSGWRALSVSYVGAAPHGVEVQFEIVTGGVAWWFDPDTGGSAAPGWGLHAVSTEFRMGGRWRWWVRHDEYRSAHEYFAPLWPPALVLGVGMARSWRRARFVAGRCGACGYSREGLGKDAACPECGRTA